MTLLQRVTIFSVFLFSLGFTMSFATKDTTGDSKFHAQSLGLSVKGTSTLHDWEMKSGQGTCDVVFELGNGDKVTGLSSLNFSTPAESLKSEHTAMDKNAYKALKTGSSKSITFALTSATITPVDANTYRINCVGKLSIAGTTKVTDLAAVCKYNPTDKSFTCSGLKKLKMTEYKVDPPSFMMGAVKTGDEISISFSTKIIR